ncbi:MAG: AMP-binding protein, partial [Burkholderiaceae bacterium]
MSGTGVDCWPPGLARHLTLPETNLWFNVEVSAARYPDKPYIVFYDTPITYAQFKRECECVAGFLQHDCGVQAGDRVLLYMQNSPQWALAFYAILRANAVVVPVNPMNRREELRHYVADSGAAVAFVPQDLLGEVQPLLHGGEGLRHAIVATYSDHLSRPTDLPVPAFVAEPRRAVGGPGVTPWHALLDAGRTPGPLTAGPDDLCVMPYTSGTTGRPKGCMHTHRGAMATLVGGIQWFGRTQDAVFLSAMPLFHVTGMVGGMSGPLFAGGTIVVLARWDRDAAAESMRRHRITVWSAISTMMIDFLSNPRLAELDLSSLQVIRGGGAAMPAAIVAALHDATGLPYVEGYGMSETLAATHLNPPQRAKPQCLGIPMFDVDSRIVDPATLQEMPQGET